MQGRLRALSGRWAAAALLVALVALVPQAVPAGASAPTHDVQTGRPHFYGPRFGPGSAATHPELLYYGGPVQSDAIQYLVHWTPRGRALPYQDTVDSFFKDISGSAVDGLLGQYSTNHSSVFSQPGTGQTITGMPTLGAIVTDSSPYPEPQAGVLSDDAIRQELLSLFSRRGGVPPPRPGHVDSYAIELGMGEQVCTSDHWCSHSENGFCAYHGTMTLDGVLFAYQVLPDIGATPCAGAPEPDIATVAASHELFETATDPGVGLSDQYGPPMAWYDPHGNNGEIGDICFDWGYGTGYFGGHPYVVQREWNNAAHACVLPTDAPAGS